MDRLRVQFVLHGGIAALGGQVGVVAGIGQGNVDVFGIVARFRLQNRGVGPQLLQLGADGLVGRPGQHLVGVQQLVLGHIDTGQGQIQVQFLGIGRDGGDQGVFGLGVVSGALIGLGQLQRQFRVVGGDDTGPAVVGDGAGIVAIGQGGVGPVHEKLLGDIGAEDQQEQNGSGQQQHHQQDGDDDFQQTLHSAAPIQL